jgi:hypothetical protein
MSSSQGASGDSCGEVDAVGKAPFDGIASAVAEFHSAFGLPCGGEPSADISAGLAALRVRLLAEEVDEFAAAAGAGDLIRRRFIS